jgi:hypothetical protein
MITPRLPWTRLSKVSSDMEFDWRSLVFIEAQFSEAVARELLIGRDYMPLAIRDDASSCRLNNIVDLSDFLALKLSE